MRIRLLKLQAEDIVVKEVKAGSKSKSESKQNLNNGWEENADGMLLYQGLFYVLEIICTELISWHHDNLLAHYFGIHKTQELIA